MCLSLKSEVSFFQIVKSSDFSIFKLWWIKLVILGAQRICYFSSIMWLKRVSLAILFYIKGQLMIFFYLFMSDKIHVVVRKDQQTYESGSDPKQSTGPYTHNPASYMDQLLDQESLFY